MTKNNSLFLKIAFVIILIMFILGYLWLLTNSLNDTWGHFLLNSFFIFLGISSVEKIYTRKFGQDFVTKYGFLLILIFSISILLISNFKRKEEIEFDKIFIKNKINETLDTCSYYEAKLYENDLLFKNKKDSSEYLASKNRKTYARFEALKNNPKYDYLVPSFIKCPRDSAELVYIFDSEGTLSVILKLKDTDSTRVNDLKLYLQRFQSIGN